MNLYKIVACFSSIYWPALILLCSTACQQFPTPQALQAKAAQQGWQPSTLTTPTFSLLTQTKITQLSAPLIIYLEGDGHSCLNKYQLSDDPTPRQPIGLALALQDHRPNLAYLARPCQYLRALDPKCHPRYWSTHRFSAEVISATHSAIEQLKSKAQAQKIHLVGFSGGGGLAVLVAAQRADVLSLTTIAGDLDIDFMRQYHHSLPLTGSQNPLQVAPALRHIPQQHWIGAQDSQVPAQVSKNYYRESQPSDCVKIQVAPDTGHHQGWVKNWAHYLQQPHHCAQAD
jgi:hypothetical protein